MRDVENSPGAQWIEHLEPEDLAFIKRFVLASGSLKDLAAGYGISYPTVRLRLDRLIAKIQVVDSQHGASEFEQILRARYAEGKVDFETFKALLAAHQKELESRDDLPVRGR